MDTERRDRVGDVLAIAVCVGFGLVGVWTDVLPEGVDGWEVVGLVVGVAVFGTVFWRRRFPVLFWAVTAVVGILAPLAGFLSLVGVFTVAVHRRWPVTAVVTVVSLVGIAVDFWFSGDPGFLYNLTWASAFVAAVAMSGLFIGARRELVATLRERAERAEAEQELRAEQARTAERRRIAREMHDVLGHRLSLLSVHAGALELRGDLSAETVHRTAGVLRETARAAMDDLREIVLVLREPGLDEDGPQPRLADVPDLVEQSRGAGVRIDLDESVAGAPPDGLGRTAYRVVQEGLTNARRHAAGAPVRVELSGRPGAALTVRVVTGPVPSDPGERGSGTGLIGLRERVSLAGGELGHGTGPDGAHVLTAAMPWPVAER